MRSLKNFSYNLKSDFDIPTTMKQLRELFECESINFDINLNIIKSTATPFPILSFDFRALSRLNWIGINPFVYISAISIKANGIDHNSTIVNVEIDQRRAIMIYMFVSSLLLLISSALPTTRISIIFLVLALAITGYIIFGICVRYLIKKEINNVIKA